MTLSLSGKEVVATPELISKVVHDENYRNEFFTLSREDVPCTFIQATGPNDALHVEYRDGLSDDDHYVCKSTLSCEQLEELCLRYFNGDSTALQNYDWCKLEDYSPPAPKSGGGVTSWSFS